MMKNLIQAICIMIFMLGISCILHGVGLVNSCPKTMKDFNDISYSEPIEGKYLQGNISHTLGYYDEEYRGRSNKIPATTYRYYLIPFGERQQKYIGIRVRDWECDKFDQLSLDTSDEGHLIGKYQGVVKRCDGYAEEKILKKLQKYTGIEDCSDLYVPYYIEYINIDLGRRNIVDGTTCILVVGIILLVFGILKLIKRYFNNSNSINSVNSITINDNNYYYVNNTKLNKKKKKKKKKKRRHK